MKIYESLHDLKNAELNSPAHVFRSSTDQLIIQDCSIQIDLKASQLVHAFPFTKKITFSNVTFTRGLHINTPQSEPANTPTLEFKKCSFKVAVHKESTDKNRVIYRHLRISSEWKINLVSCTCGILEIYGVKYPRDLFSSGTRTTKLILNKVLFTTGGYSIGNRTFKSNKNGSLGEADISQLELKGLISQSHHISLCAKRIRIEDCDLPVTAIATNGLYVYNSKFCSLNCEKVEDSKELIQLYLSDTHFEFVPNFLNIPLKDNFYFDNLSFNSRNLSNSITYEHERDFTGIYKTTYFTPISWRLKHMAAACEHSNRTTAITLNSYYHLLEAKSPRKSVKISSDYWFIRLISKALQAVNGHGIYSYYPFLWLIGVWFFFTLVYLAAGIEPAKTAYAMSIDASGNKQELFQLAAVYADDLCKCGQAALYSGRLTLLGAFANFSDNQPFVPSSVLGAIFSLAHQIIATWLWYIAIVTLRRRFSL